MRTFSNRLLCVLGIFGLCFAYFIAVPSIKPLSSRLVGENKASIARLPFNFKREHTSAYLEVAYKPPFFGGNRFLLQADDCVEIIWVNAQRVFTDELPICAYPYGRELSLAPYLLSGKNTLKFKVRNYKGPGGFSLQLSSGDPYLLVLRVLFLLALGALIVNLRLFAGEGGKALACLFTAGVLLRVVYWFATPYWTRAYDWNDHLAYIDHFRANSFIPAATDGWQFYQAPLYYWLMARLLDLLEFLGLPEHYFSSGVQLCSLVFSILSLWLAFTIASKLFAESSQAALRITFCLLIVVLPGLLFFSSRVSNDTLLQLFCFWTLSLLVSWWLEGKEANYYFAQLLIAVGVLVKVSMLVFVPLSFALLFLSQKDFRKKILRTSLSIVVLLSISGWYFVLRYLEGGWEAFQGSIPFLSSGLEVSSSWLSFLVFNPWDLLQSPFNLSWEQETRREYFWEFFFRSVFFGEFNLGQSFSYLAAGVLLFAMLLLFPLGLGISESLKNRDRQGVFLLITSLAFFAALLLFRLKYPYVSCQDFRHVSIVALPMAYFLAQGIEQRRSLFFPLALVFSFLNVVLVLFLYFSRPPFYV